MVVWRLDFLGQSAKELLAIGEDLHEHGLRCGY
jgi:DNA invertase Pin-like site-specific DNA recombinase